MVSSPPFKASLTVMKIRTEVGNIKRNRKRFSII